ncbi:hypothetical protein HGB07_05890 [Candidatus Roizmanbacteria bacterium]|nr:hypothetical protein [Candidatus Roizmanbacteria bacterium]
MTFDYMYFWIGGQASQYGIKDFQTLMPKERFRQEYDSFTSPRTGLAHFAAFKEHIIDLLLGV